jgi:hypothetical protein
MAEILVSDLRDDRPPLIGQEHDAQGPPAPVGRVRRARPATLADPEPAAAMQKSETPDAL